MTMFPKIDGIYALLDDCPIRCAVHEFRENLYVNTGPLIRLLTPQDDGSFHDDGGRRWTIVAPSADTQPASTALVETLTSALQKAESVLVTYADPTGYTDGYGDQVPADAVQHEGLLAQEALDVVRSALSASQSTSREGER